MANKRKLIIDSITDLTDWLKSREGVFILINGGYERTFRDKLMFQVQMNLKKGFVASEFTLRNKRPDILIIDDAEELEEKNTVIEIKTNTLDQIAEITGKSKRDVIKDIKNYGCISVIGANNRLMDDFDRWKDIENTKPIYFIYVIVETIALDKMYSEKINYLYKNIFKPKSYNIGHIEKYFIDISFNYIKAKVKMIYKKCLPVGTTKPFFISLKVHTYIFEMSNKSLNG